MRIVQAHLDDIDSVAALRHALWPEASVEDLFEESRDLIADQGAGAAVFLAFADRNAVAIGLAEVTMRRDFVNGCTSGSVAFLEGIYVDPRYRRHGVARALVAAAQRWGSARGCREFASDALIDNVASHRFHEAVGFKETQRVVYFRKPLGRQRR